jgi:hypothetical protein
MKRGKPTTLLASSASSMWSLSSKAQVEETLNAWKRDSKRAPALAALIVYGRIEGRKKLPGRIPRAEAVISGVVARFLKHGTLLVIAESGARQYSFTDFMR